MKRGKGLPDLAHWATPGAVFQIRATPRARMMQLEPGPTPADPIRIKVTAPPEDGRANEAIRQSLAQALGVAPGRLTLVYGASARDKRFQLD